MYKIFLVLTALVAVNGQGYGKGHHDIDYYAEPHYSFEYEVKDLHTKDIKSHKEQRKGDHTQGVYMLVEPDGSKRVIEYEVIGKKGGWLPKVHRDKDIHVDKKGHGKGESVQNYNLYQGKVQEVVVESHGHQESGYGGSSGGYSSGGSSGGYSSGGSLGGYSSGGSLGGYGSEGSSLGGSLGGYGESSLGGSSLGGYEESSLGGYGSEGSSLGGSSLGGYESEGNSLGGYESSSGSSGYGHESSSGSSGYGHSSGSSSSSGHYESSGYSHGGATSSVKYSTNGAKVTLSTNHVVPQKKYGY